MFEESSALFSALVWEMECPCLPGQNFCVSTFSEQALPSSFKFLRLLPLIDSSLTIPKSTSSSDETLLVHTKFASLSLWSRLWWTSGLQLGSGTSHLGTRCTIFPPVFCLGVKTVRLSLAREYASSARAEQFYWRLSMKHWQDFWPSLVSFQAELRHVFSGINEIQIERFLTLRIFSLNKITSPILQ